MRYDLMLLAKVDSKFVSNVYLLNKFGKEILETIT